ncbi:MAG TPA: hypothetical protein DEG32_03370, partial [Balneolaceae bacterium]|nr:hypothetical protein [Balneolaceae bacterium]
AMILKENPRPLAAGFESKNENQNTQETLQGDLESIVQKALRKEPEERYDSAGEFLEDIERFEQNLPVAAVNGSFQYKSRKFLRRNRRAIAISLTMLISAISFGTYHFYEISAERNRANLEAKKATQVTDYIIDLFALANPEKNQNDTLTVFNLLDLGLDKINDLEGQPELQLGFLAAIGDAYYRVGDWDRSGQIHIAADSFANEIYPENHFEVLKTSINRTKTYINDRNYNAALEYAEKAYRISEAYFPDNWYLKASALNNVGQALNYLNPDSAENYLLESIDLLEQNNARLDRILNSKNYLGINYRTRQEFEKAEAVYLDILESIKISESLNLTGIKSVTDNNLGYLYSRKKEYKKAEFHYREAQSYMVDIYGEAHPRSLILANNIRGILFLQNKLEEAKMHTLKQIEIIKNHYGELHWRTASEISSLGNSYLVSGEPQKSYQHYSRSFQIYDEVLGENHPWTIVALINEELSALLIENGSVQTRFDTAYDKLEQLISNGNFSTSAYSNLNASLNRFREYSTSDISEELDRINDLLSQDSES